MLGLMGRKKGMTQIFDDAGNLIPVTVIEAGPCVVTQKKNKASDGYSALQLGFGVAKAKHVRKPQQGHLKAQGKNLGFYRTLKEFRTANVEQFEVGDVVGVQDFSEVNMVKVAGTSKGKGFQGVIKRHHKHGGPASHGSTFHRSTGSIGMCAWPGRVLKNMKLPGQMGDVKVTTRNLQVAKLLPDENLILIRGAVPGAKNSLVTIYAQNKDFEKKNEQKDVKEENGSASS